VYVYPESNGSFGSGGTKIDWQVPLAQSAFAEQVRPLFNLQAGCPSPPTAQMFTPPHGVAGDGSGPPAIGRQVPGLCAWLQLTQSPSHAVLQQTPSTQLTVTQSAAEAHMLPLLPRHSPRPLQLFVPEHPSRSTNRATGAQVPSNPATEHDWQADPHEAVPQQTPSMQWPDTHWSGEEQILPRAFLQAPAPSHIESPVQASSAAFFTAEHVPTLPVCAQLTQAPSHAVSQQTPSTQKPLAHWAAIVHA